MATMNVSLPDTLKTFVDDQVAQHGYGTSSAYIQELIRKDRDREALRRLLLDGAASPLAGPANTAYFYSLRQGVRDSART
jgi:antitoxin ParD1/3/4